MKMSNSLYDILKYVVQIVLPAMATCYVALAKIWNWPFSAEVAGSVTAVCTLLGTCLMISNSNYKKENTGIPEEE